MGWANELRVGWAQELKVYFFILTKKENIPNTSIMYRLGLQLSFAHKISQKSVISNDISVLNRKISDKIGRPQRLEEEEIRGYYQCAQ